MSANGQNSSVEMSGLQRKGATMAIGVTIRSSYAQTKGQERLPWGQSVNDAEVSVKPVAIQSVSLE